MSRPFLEERLPVRVRMGASYGDDYNVEIVETAGGAEYPRLVHPFPRRRFSVAYTQEFESLWDDILSLYHRVYGRYAGFRVYAMDDRSTNGTIGVPTAFDETLPLVSAGVYQLIKTYGKGGTPLGIGLPTRTLYKPVAGTTKLGIVNPTTGNHQITAFSTDTTTGRVTLAANKSRAITAITQAASAVVTVGSNAFVVGDSVHFSNIVGMTQLNGRRGAVTAVGGTTITVAINTSGFSAYANGGTVQTSVQAGETVKGGCEFDLPCRFDTVIDINTLSHKYRQTTEIEIVELLDEFVP